MALLFVRLALQTDNYAVVDQTTDARILICRSDGENEQCSASKRLQHFKNLLAITAKFITISIMKDISKPGMLINGNVLLL